MKKGLRDRMSEGHKEGNQTLDVDAAAEASAAPEACRLNVLRGVKFHERVSERVFRVHTGNCYLNSYSRRL